MSIESIYGRRFRPLMPRPFFTTPTPCFSMHKPKIPSRDQSLCVGDRRDISRGMPMVMTARWNPTPEQLEALEEMYRRGTKSPSAEQIQQIAAKLRKFGRIEGKNVFYWFQNHKARDRQKKRRQIELSAGKDTRQSGLSGRYLEIEHPNKKLATMSNCNIFTEYSLSLHGAEVEEFKREGCKKIIRAKSRDTCCCWPLDISSSLSPNNSMHNITDQKAKSQENVLKIDYLKFFASEIKENQTLELFPVRSNDLSNNTKDETNDASSIGTKLVPSQFFEFLPTKN